MTLPEDIIAQYEELGLSTLDTTKLNGIGFNSENKALTRLVQSIDSFIELNTCKIISISFSKDFELKLRQEVGKTIYGIRTLIGDASVVVRSDQKADIVCFG